MVCYLRFEWVGAILRGRLFIASSFLFLLFRFSSSLRGRFLLTRLSNPHPLTCFVYIEMELYPAKAGFPCTGLPCVSLKDAFSQTGLPCVSLNV